VSLPDPSQFGLSGTDAESFLAQAERLAGDERVAQALYLAATAHRGQRDRAGKPYIFHPLHLALAAGNAEERCVALLHDVLEDTDVTSEQLSQHGFGARIVRAVTLLTRRSDETYEQFILRVAGDRLASRVKLLDLAHNSDLSRLPGAPSEQDLARQRRYAAATATLRAELEKRNLYLVLDDTSRGVARQRALLPIVRAEHVTLAHRVLPTEPLSAFLDPPAQLGQQLTFAAVAQCQNELVQAWVLELNGSSRRKHDGGTLHLTVSRSAQARSRDSNDLLKHGARTPMAATLVGTLSWVDE